MDKQTRKLLKDLPKVCVCGGNMVYEFDFDRVWSHCDKCTPTINVDLNAFSLKPDENPSGMDFSKFEEKGRQMAQDVDARMSDVLNRLTKEFELDDAKQKEQQATFVRQLMEGAKDHQAWLSIMRFGLTSLTNDTPLICELIVREATAIRGDRRIDQVMAEIMGELELYMMPMGRC